MHHCTKLSRECIANDRYHPISTGSNQRKCDGIIAADDQKIFLAIFDNGHDLLHVATGLLDADHIFAIERNSQGGIC